MRGVGDGISVSVGGPGVPVMGTDVADPIIVGVMGMNEGGATDGAAVDVAGPDALIPSHAIRNKTTIAATACFFISNPFCDD